MTALSKYMSKSATIQRVTMMGKEPPDISFWLTGQDVTITAVVALRFGGEDVTVVRDRKAAPHLGQMKVGESSITLEDSDLIAVEDALLRLLPDDAVAETLCTLLLDGMAPQAALEAAEALEYDGGR
jgi:hypothetical protein